MREGPLRGVRPTLANSKLTIPPCVNNIPRRYVDIRKAVVIVLMRMVSHEQGKAAFKAARGLSTVFELVKSLEGATPAGFRFVQLCSSLLRKCQPSASIPPPVSSVSFPLPLDELPAGVLLADDVLDSDEEEAVATDPAQASIPASGGGVADDAAGAESGDEEVDEHDAGAAKVEGGSGSDAERESPLDELSDGNSADDALGHEAVAGDGGGSSAACLGGEDAKELQPGETDETAQGSPARSLFLLEGVNGPDGMDSDDVADPESRGLLQASDRRPSTLSGKSTLSSEDGSLPDTDGHGHGHAPHAADDDYDSDTLPDSPRKLHDRTGNESDTPLPSSPSGPNFDAGAAPGPPPPNFDAVQEGSEPAGEFRPVAATSANAPAPAEGAPTPTTAAAADAHCANGGAPAIDPTLVDHLLPELYPESYLETLAQKKDMNMQSVSTVRAATPGAKTPTALDHGATALHLDRNLREPTLSVPNRALRRSLLYEDMEMFTKKKAVTHRLVYDVDNPVPAGAVATPHLKFDSHFESGNLRQATQIGPTMYDLVTSPDINSTGHTQWFYFAVSGMKPGRRYKFNIVNLEKTNSQFNFGMQPVMFSNAKWSSDKVGWHRVGKSICYFKNDHVRDKPSSKNNSHYFTVTFSLEFETEGDTCFLAYHYPYTLSDHLSHMLQLERAARPQECLVRQLLCRTLAGNRCDLLTVTSFRREDLESFPVASREYVFLSARVHPGESNASWMMKGLLDFIISTDPVAERLRRTFVFKIVPMLNPDGVANGSASRAVQFHPDGGQFDFVWLSTRTMHPHDAPPWGVHRTCGA